MSDQEQETSQEQSSSPSEPTLEQVYQQFSVEDTASQFKAAPQQPQYQPQYQPQQPAQQPTGDTIPDPVLDPNGFKSWQSQQNSALRQAVTQAQGTAQSVAAYLSQQKEQADIKNAVSAVKSKVGDTSIDDDFIEIALGVKARKDPRFLQVYNARDKNPQAWNAALAAVAGELKGKVSMKVDPQLTENVRAAKASTQSSLTTKDQGSDNPYEKFLNDANDPRDFANRWDRLVHGGN